MADFHKISDCPQASLDALKNAMARTGVPENWYDDLAWIMAQESTGKVGIRNHSSSAAGLFQLTRASYNLMPNGESSIGIAVDEAIGGIKYIQNRYHTAAQAKTFWIAHHWY